MVEIPDLKDVKVTDESFRQFQKLNQQAQTASSGHRDEKVALKPAEASQQSTIRNSSDIPPRPQPAKQIIIPKL